MEKNAVLIKKFLTEGSAYNIIGKWIFVLLIFLGIVYLGTRYPTPIIVLTSTAGFTLFWALYGFWAGFLGAMMFFTAVVIILVIAGIIYEIFEY